MILRQTYISRLEADLEALKLERLLTEMKDAAGDGQVGNEALAADMASLRVMEQSLRARLDRARKGSDSHWDEAREELQRGWEELKAKLAALTTRRPGDDDG